MLNNPEFQIRHVWLATKAFNLIQTELSNSYLREANRSLFHAEMSFLGSYLIEEPGFREILKPMYLSIKSCGPRKSTESSSDRIRDTTSLQYGVGKATVLLKFDNVSHLESKRMCLAVIITCIMLF